ncbi:Crp/Fnr family transcriptional regulator [Sphingomonas ginkgonis]|uniref:Crp/Fnr family transcriptional regulator n=1 Tax=Sphingomonas ginkgonis TaxID=2315330 RepID=A0A429VBN8_9SPHN|nr:Crp/Fnr family transcriptional regulator [Sphingomonas ginkgonis]RST31296.1 Crp/Fnr family transcriptional regulator [Sphingomonas ginkgonis]
MDNRFIDKLRNFSELSAEAILALRQATDHPRSIQARRDLIREGDRPGPVFVILDGWACRYKILPDGGRQILAYLMPGDCCDLHVGLLAEMDHSIQTITSAAVATVGRDQMEEIFSCHPEVGRAMYIAQLVDEGTMRAWITSMGRRSSIERVAHLMCELYIRCRNIGLTTDMVVSLPFSQILLADSLGMTPVHLNRVLKELRSRGAMELQRGKLIIVDPKRLVQIAGFDENYLHRRFRPAGESRQINDHLDNAR